MGNMGRWCTELSLNASGIFWYMEFFLCGLIHVILYPDIFWVFNNQPPQNKKCEILFLIVISIFELKKPLNLAPPWSQVLSYASSVLWVCEDGNLSWKGYWENTIVSFWAKPPSSWLLATTHFLRVGLGGVECKYIKDRIKESWLKIQRNGVNNKDEGKRWICDDSVIA